MKTTGQQSGRYAKVPARAVDDRRLSRSTLAMLVALGTYSDRNGWCWPSVSTLAVRLGVSERQAKRMIRELEQLGYIKTQRQFDSHRMEISARRQILFSSKPATDKENLFEGGEATRHPGVAPHDTPGVSSQVQKGVVPDDTQTSQRTSHINTPLRGDANGASGNDLSKVIFGTCLSYLINNGVQERNARSLLGKWRKGVGDGEVIKLITDAEKQSVSEPIAWIEAAINRGAGDGDYAAWEDDYYKGVH